jgi:hypothetical protein
VASEARLRVKSGESRHQALGLRVWLFGKVGMRETLVRCDSFPRVIAAVVHNKCEGHEWSCRPSV